MKEEEYISKLEKQLILAKSEGLNYSIEQRTVFDKESNSYRCDMVLEIATESKSRSFPVTVVLEINKTLEWATFSTAASSVQTMALSKALTYAGIIVDGVTSPIEKSLATIHRKANESSVIDSGLQKLHDSLLQSSVDEVQNIDMVESNKKILSAISEATNTKRGRPKSKPTIKETVIKDSLQPVWDSLRQFNITKETWEGACQIPTGAEDFPQYLNKLDSVKLSINFIVWFESSFMINGAPATGDLLQNWFVDFDKKYASYPDIMDILIPQFDNNDAKLISWDIIVHIIETHINFFVCQK